MGETLSHLRPSQASPPTPTCSCWELLEKLRGEGRVQDAQRREDFELTVSFLATVPLFCKQLPRSELPKVAQSLTRRVWRPGQRLVRQGEIGRALFLIVEGEATVATSLAPGEPEQVHATLYAGDYFGGHTLMTERPNVATIIAKGPHPLVTLSMSRQAFEDSGLKNCLRFPKRPALYDGNQTNQTSSDLAVPVRATESTRFSEEEEEFICSAVRRNGNLRAFVHEASHELLQAVAAGAEKRSVREGEVIAQRGTVCRELFIVRQGLVKAVVPAAADSRANQSAEGVLARSAMAERLLRKEHVMREIFGDFPVPGADSLDADFFRSQSYGCAAGDLITEQLRTRSLQTTSHPSAASAAGASLRHQHLQQVLQGRCEDREVEAGLRTPLRGARRGAGRQPKQRLQASGAGSGSASAIASVTLASAPGATSATMSCCVEDLRSHPQDPPAPAGLEALQGIAGQMERAPAADALTTLALSPVGASSLRARARARARARGHPCRLNLRGGESGPSGRFVTFAEGESFGELSLVYDMKLEADFVASSDSVVYAIPRRHLMTWFRGGNQRFHEYSKFLREVYALSQLLNSERWELACKAKGLVDFKPGERVLSQGQPRQARLWYIIHSGSAVMTRTAKLPSGEDRTKKMADLYRSSHFGERSLLRGDQASQVTVDAGPNGVCCLTFDGETVLPVLQAIFQEDNNLCPSPRVDIEEWCRGKNRGWERTNGFNRLTSSGQQLDWSKDGSAGARHLELKALKHVAVLGRGSFGQVILVEDPRTERCFALKTVSKGHVKRRHAERQIQWERELLSMLDSDFIIALHKTFSDEQHVYFLLEAALGGSLLEVLHLHSEVLLEDQPHGSAAAFYIGCLTLALEHMHERRIVHRDVKPENVFLDSQGFAKLGDMGFARFVLGKTNTRVGTPDYMAPEMIDFPHSHDMTVDWWSMGVLAYELLAGQSPWEDEGISDSMERLLTIRRSQQESKLRFPFHFPQSARALVSGLLQPARSRLGARGAAEIKGQQLFSAVGLDFRALASRRLPSPYRPSMESSLVAPLLSSSSSEGEDLSPGPGDSIFMSYKVSCDDNWDQGF